MLKGALRPATRIVTGISVAAAVAAGLCLTASSVAAAESPKWGAFLDLEGKLGTARHLGEADLFLPLAQNSDTLLFGDIRFRLDNEDSREGNFGLGLRHMLPGGWNLGAYGYFDRRRTDAGHYFNQATVGAELLGRDLDFRVNGYLPLGDRVKGLGSASSAFAQLSGTVVQVVTPGATALEERALSGFDVEAGWRVPLFAAEGPYDLRLYGGLFRFDDHAVEAVTGPRFRTELTAFEAPGLWDGARVTLGAEWQRDDARGSQGFAGIRLRLPLQPEARDDARLTLQARRMTAPVVRDIDIVTQAHSKTETLPATVETAVNAATGQALDNVTVLDSADPFGSDLSDELNAAGTDSLVILNGTFNTTAGTTMMAGQTLMGGGKSLTVRGADTGVTATFTAPGGAGTLAGTSFVTLGMADDSTISGLTVSSTRASAIDIIGNDRVTITDSTILATGGVIVLTTAIRAASTDGLTLRNNTIVATANNNAEGINFVINNTNVTVAGNSFDVTGGGKADAIYANNNASFITAASTGNTLVNGSCTTDVSVTGSVGFVDSSTCP